MFYYFFVSLLVREYSKEFLCASNAFFIVYDAVGTQTMYVYIYIFKRIVVGDTNARYF